MMPINSSAIAIAERYAREFFNLGLPITSESLKSAFRAECKRLHTDTSGNASTKDAFIKMKMPTTSWSNSKVTLQCMEF